MIEITPEVLTDAPGVEQLLDTAFGADRFKKRSYSYREGIERLWRLCMVARDGDKLVGTIRYWPIRIGENSPALLLGPIAVDKSYRDCHLGAALMRLSLGLAAAGGHRLVVLVGDEAYYGKFGFTAASNYAITMDQENPQRLLARWLGSLPASFQGGCVLRDGTGISVAA